MTPLLVRIEHLDVGWEYAHQLGGGALLEGEAGGPHLRTVIEHEGQREVGRVQLLDGDVREARQREGVWGHLPRPFPFRYGDVHHDLRERRHVDGQHLERLGRGGGGRDAAGRRHRDDREQGRACPQRPSVVRVNHRRSTLSALCWPSVRDPATAASTATFDWRAVVPTNAPRRTGQHPWSE